MIGLNSESFFEIKDQDITIKVTGNSKDFWKNDLKMKAILLLIDSIDSKGLLEKNDGYEIADEFLQEVKERLEKVLFS